jgi:HK97 family phage portal protein
VSLLSWLGKKIKLTDGAFWAQYYGNSSATGKVVTPDSALHVSAAWACIRLLSETTGILPISVYRNLPGGGTEVDSQHWLNGLIHDDPNADQTASEYWEGNTACLNLWGNGYSFKEQSGSRTIALIPINPDTMRVYRDSFGARRYQFSERGKREDLPEDKVFHIRGFGVGGDLGLSPISYARESLGIAMSADEAAGKMFANGMLASGFVTGPNGLKEDQRTQITKILKDFIGSQNANKIMVLEQGMDFKTIQMNPNDMQMLQSRAWAVEEVCRWFRVPPFMVGHTEKSTSWGTGLEQQMIGFLTFALQPYLNRIEKAARKQLLPPGERSRYTVKFNVEGLLRADSQGRATFLSMMTQNGIMSRNEARAKENLPPVDGGDELTVQSNLIPLGHLGDITSTTEQQARNALRSWLGVEQPKQLLLPPPSGDQA